MKQQRHHILIVDDNPMNRKLLSAILEAEGYDVFEAPDGEAALSLMTTAQADVVVSDILMPNMDGFRFCYELRKSEQYATTPFLFLSATYTSPSDEKLALELGADMVLKRPIPAAEILAHIRNVLTQPVYHEPRAIRQPRTVEMIKEYSEALMAKLEEKNAELQMRTEQLKASEEQFRAIAETAEDLIAVLDLEGKRLYNSPSYERLIGDLAKLRGTDSFREIHPDDRQRIREVFRTTVATAKGQRAEYRFLLPDGSIRYIESQGSVIRDPEGRPSRVVVVSRDVSERKRTEETLRKLSSAVEQAGDSVVITDRDGVIEYVNPAFERNTGYPRNAILGKTPRVLKSGKHEMAFYQSIWDTILSRKVFRGEVINKRSNGELYYEHQTISPVLDDHGNILYFVSAGRDMTDQKRLDESLRLSERKYRMLFEFAPTGIYQARTDGTIVAANNALAQMLGYTSPDDVVGLHLTEDVYLYPRERMDLLQRFRAEGHARDVEVRWKQKDGATIWVHINAYLIQNDVGKEQLIVGLATDITARKMADAALVQSEVRYRTLFEESRDGLFIANAEGKIIDTNIALGSILGCHDKEEVLALDFLSTLHAPTVSGETLVARLFRDRSFENLEVALTRKDGNIAHALLSMSAVENVSGEVMMLRGLVRDVTQQRLLEQQLIQAQKLESLGTLAGGVAHDFNNILAIIMGQATLLERAGIDPGKSKRAIDAITQAAQRGATLIQQLLTFARKQEVTLEPVILGDIVREVVALLEGTIPKLIAVDTHLGHSLPLMVADSSQLHQVLLNLCVNARDAMLPVGGTLTISTSVVDGETLRSRHQDAEANRYLLLAVSDTGCGMNDSTRERIFEPFFTTKEKGKGTGLGLATVYGIMVNHHGFIDVASDVGQGTAFYLYFPEMSLAPADPGGGEETFAGGMQGTETVLLVEDEELIREFVVEILTDEGYTVHTANDGETGVELYRREQEKIQVVLTDMGLPKMSGERLIGELRAINPNIAVVVASGVLDPDVKTELMKSGVTEFIQKPYRPDALLLTLRHILDTKTYHIQRGPS
jgi:PAS domain S-box-containing protein